MTCFGDSASLFLRQKKTETSLGVTLAGLDRRKQMILTELGSTHAFAWCTVQEGNNAKVSTTQKHNPNEVDKIQSKFIARTY
jgi:hypothetical protein